MEPITIIVKVELGEKTLKLLKGLALLQADEATAEAVTRIVNTPAGPENYSGKADKSEAEEPSYGSTAPMPEKNSGSAEITDADLREVVKETKDRVGAKPIREVFSAMGIASSVECPPERRTELVAALKNLK